MPSTTTRRRESTRSGIKLLGNRGGFMMEQCEAPVISSIDDTFTVVAIGHKRDMDPNECRTPWMKYVFERSSPLPEVAYVLGRIDHYRGSPCKCGEISYVDMVYVGDAGKESFNESGGIRVTEMDSQAFRAMYDLDVLPRHRRTTFRSVQTKVLIVGDPAYFEDYKTAIEQALLCRVDIARTAEKAAEMEGKNNYDLAIVSLWDYEREDMDRRKLVGDFNAIEKPVLLFCSPKVGGKLFYMSLSDEDDPATEEESLELKSPQYHTYFQMGDSEPKKYIRTIKELLPGRFAEQMPAQAKD